jgi:DNA-binding transcriptional MerR regulator
MSLETLTEATWSPAACGTSNRASIAAVRTSLGITYRAIRHYEELGLIACGRDARGQRWLDGAAVDRLTVIRDLRRAGVTVRRAAQIVLGQGAMAPAVVAELKVQALAVEAQQARIRALIDDWAALGGSN